MFDRLEKFQVLLLSVVIALAVIISAKIIIGAIPKDSVVVTGSYSQNVTSDSGRFEFEIISRKPTKAEAYVVVNQQKPVVLKYLEEKGFKSEDIEFRTPSGYNTYKTLPNGIIFGSTAIVLLILGYTPVLVLLPVWV